MTEPAFFPSATQIKEVNTLSGFDKLNPDQSNFCVCLAKFIVEHGDSHSLTREEAFEVLHCASRMRRIGDKQREEWAKKQKGKK